MKKMMLVMAAASLVVGGTVQAQSETVTSVNVVGYYSVSIPANGAALVTPVLEPFGSAVGTIGDLVGEQLPANSSAFIWDRGLKTYVAASKGARGGWIGAGSSKVILRGDAVWLIPPKNGTPYTVTIMGEAPGAYNEAASSTVANISGADAVGYAYPVDIVWTNSTLAKALPNNSSLFIWDLATQNYVPYAKGTRAGWTTPAGFKIPAGTAFWVTTTTPMDWEEVVPYDL